MIVHIAIFKWKSNVPKEKIEQAMKNVRQLKKKCRGVIDIMCGENFSKYGKGYTHSIIVLAKDRKALENYRNHPDHKEVADIIEQIEEDGIGVDFEN